MGEYRRQIIWSSQARADLDGIWDCYEQTAGSNTAETIVRRIHQMCAVLAQHPFAGRARDELRERFRSIAAAPYVVFYQVRANDVPEIVRVFDVRQDIESAL
jgi:plasmid stabilization system protein ParE